MSARRHTETPTAGGRFFSAADRSCMAVTTGFVLANPCSMPAHERSAGDLPEGPSATFLKTSRQPTADALTEAVG